MRTERRVADWQCNRCGNIEQITVAVLRDEVGNMPDDDLIPMAPLPNGWVKVELTWNNGATLYSDLCTTCAEKVDGFIQKRYDLVEKDKDVVTEDGAAKPKPARKRTAKKAP